jgi:hypothetical protein
LRGCPAKFAAPSPAKSAGLVQEWLPECYGFRPVLACRFSSVIWTRFELRSWPPVNWNPVPIRHRQRVRIALAVFPFTGNQLFFDQSFSRIADRPWGECGIGCKRFVGSLECIATASIRMIAEGDVEQTCRRLEGVCCSTAKEPVWDFSEAAYVHRHTMSSDPPPTSCASCSPIRRRWRRCAELVRKWLFPPGWANAAMLSLN